MTSEKIAKAQRLRDAGKTYQAIADVLGVSRETIRRNLNPSCMEKNRLYTKQYCADHREGARVRGKRYYANHIEKERVRTKQYYANHKEERIARARQYYADHIEEGRARARQYCADHKEERSAYSEQYYANHKKERCAYSKQYRVDHKEEVREYKQAHKSENAADTAKRRSLIAEATIGDMDQIREIYRIAREEPKVRCYLCLKLIPMGDRAVDHIFPVSRGGPFRPSTIAVTHKGCNGRKGAKTPEEIGLLL